MAEIIVYKQKKKYGIRRRRNRILICFSKVKNCVVLKIVTVVNAVRRVYRRAMHEAFVATLEYLE